ncbi:hypothetical protein KI387_005411, partial [Taxus chinensis]
MEQARTMGIKLLHARGDAELIVKQIRGLYQVKKDKLRHYRDRVYSAILDLSAFS